MQDYMTFEKLGIYIKNKMVESLFFMSTTHEYTIQCMGF